MKLRLLLALLLSCTLLHAEEEEEVWPEAFSKHFKGSIGGKLEVEMELNAEPGTDLFNGQRQYRGSYWYTSKRIPIDLYGTEPAYMKVELEEQVFMGGDTGWEQTGSFKGELQDDGSFTGTWTDKDGKKSLPFKLSPYQPPGSVKIKAHGLESSWRERTAEGAASLEHTALILQVVGDTPAVEKINQALLQHVHAYFVEESAEEDHPDEKKEPSPSKKPEALTLDSISEAMQAERDEELITNHEKWSYSYTTAVELNENGILCTSHLLSQYTGGAHPNSITEFHVFNTKTGKELPLEQLFKADFLPTLAKIATERLRKQEQPDVKDDTGPSIESLTDEDEDHAWFLTPAGLVVHFNPYAIASYARGNVQVTVPWSDLAPGLSADSPLKKFLPAKK